MPQGPEFLGPHPSLPLHSYYRHAKFRFHLHLLPQSPTCHSTPNLCLLQYVLQIKQCFDYIIPQLKTFSLFSLKMEFKYIRHENLSCPKLLNHPYFPAASRVKLLFTYFSAQLPFNHCFLHLLPFPSLHWSPMAIP